METNNKEIDFTIIDTIIGEHGKNSKNLIKILQEVQKKYNYLPLPALKRIHDLTGIPASQIHGVAAFYSDFRLEPAGIYTIKVCFGTACYVKGADKLYNDFKEYLNAGLEYGFREMIFLRGGYKGIGVSNQEVGYSIGGGVNYSLDQSLKLKLDYAYTHFGRLENAQRISLSIGF